MKPKVRSGAKRSKSAVAPKIKTSELLESIRQAVNDSWANHGILGSPIKVGFDIQKGAAAIAAAIVVNGYRRYTVTSNKGLEAALKGLLSIATSGHVHGPDKHFEA